MDSITAFGWSGSALLGGFLVDRHGFAPVFLATAGLQLFGTLAFTGPLLFMIPRHEVSVARGHDEPGGTSGESAAMLAGSDLDSTVSIEDELDVRSSIEQLRDA